MTDTAEFRVVLDDDVSGPAKKAGKSLASLGKGALSLGKTLAMGAGAIAGVGLAVGVVLADLAETAGKLGDQKAVFNAFGKEGTDAFERIRKFGSEAGMELGHVSEIATDLGRAFDPKSAEALFKVIADAASAGALDDGGVKKLTQGIVELGNKSAIGASDLQKFAKDAGGIDLSALTAKVAEATGRSTEELNSLIKQGKLAPQELIKGFQLLNQAKLGSDVLGAGALEDAAGDSAAQLQRLQNVYLEFKDNVAEALFSGSSMGGFKGLVDVIAGAVPSVETLGKVFSVLGNIFGAVGTLLGGLYNAVKPVIVALVEGLGGGLGSTEESGQAFMSTLTNVIDVVVKLAGILSTILVPAARLVGATVGTLINIIGTLASLISGALSAGMTAITQFGPNIIQGLLDGLASGPARISKFFTDMAGSAVGAFKSALGIASPSKVFAEMGVNTVEGFSTGVEEEAPSATQAVGTMASDVVDAGSQGLSTAPLPVGGGSSSKSITISFGDIIVNGASSPGEARQVASTIVSSLQDQLQRLNLAAV